jgi:hypothetical protein
MRAQGLGADRWAEELLGGGRLVEGRSRTRGFERCLPAGVDDPDVRGTQREPDRRSPSIMPSDPSTAGVPTGIPPGARRREASETS